MDDPDAARPGVLGDRGCGRPGDRVVAAQDDRDGAGRRHLADLAVDHCVPALEPGRDDVGVAGVDDGQHVEGPQLARVLERVERAGGVVGLTDCPRPEPRPGPVADAVVERRPDDRDVRVPGSDLAGIRDPRQLLERHRPDVDRQVELVERGVVPVPAVGCRVPAFGKGNFGRGVVGALGHEVEPPETAMGPCPLLEPVSVRAPPVSIQSSSGARRGDPSTRRGRSRGAQASPRNSRHAAATSSGSANRSYAVWATSVAARRVTASARGDAAASRKAVE